MNELERKLGALDRTGMEKDKAAELEREVDELEARLEQCKKEMKMDKAMQALDTIEKAAASAGAGACELRKRAESLYDDVVAAIMERDGCDARVAHARAAKDPIGKRAYATVVEMQDRECADRDGAYRLGAYLG